MSGYEAGDDITLTLDVVPEGGVPTDGTTTATVRATLDDGTTRTPTAVPNGDRSSWTATLPAAAAGEWSIVWTVTGTGSGLQSYTLLVAALPPTPPVGRSYATVGDLTRYTGQEPPPGAARLLRRATRKVDELTRTAVWSVGANGYPDDPDVAEALRDATCAQAEWWGETGDTAGNGAVAALAGAQIGTVKLPGGGAGGGGASLEFAPDAVSVLRAAGLLGGGPRIPGPNGYGAVAYR